MAGAPGDGDLRKVWGEQILGERAGVVVGICLI